MIPSERERDHFLYVLCVLAIIPKKTSPFSIDHLFVTS